MRCWEAAERRHRLARHLRLSLESANQAALQSCDRIQGWLRELRGGAILPLSHLSRRPIRGHRRQDCNRRASTAEFCAPWRAAKTPIRKTSFPSDSCRIPRFTVLRKEELAKEFANPAKGGGELVGVVGRRNFELLEKAVDGGADFGGVGGFDFFAVGDVKGIESHCGLFSGALVSQRNCFCVLCDALHGAQGELGVVLHSSQALCKTLRHGSSCVCRGHDGVFVWIELAHFRRNCVQTFFQFLRAPGIHLLRYQTENGEAGAVPGWIAGAAAGVTMFLTPTVFRRTERVVAGKAGKFGVFGPDIFFVVALAFRAPD